MCLPSSLKPKSGSSYWRWRLSTVNLHIKIGCFVKKGKFSFSLKSSCSKLVSTRRSNHTDTSPSVRLPCLNAILSYDHFMNYLHQSWKNGILAPAQPQVVKFGGNRRAHITHQCRKTAVLSRHRCLIITGVEKIYNIHIFLKLLPPDVSKEE